MQVSTIAVFFRIYLTKQKKHLAPGSDVLCLMGGICSDVTVRESCAQVAVGIGVSEIACVTTKTVMVGGGTLTIATEEEVGYECRPLPLSRRREPVPHTRTIDPLG